MKFPLLAFLPLAEDLATLIETLLKAPRPKKVAKEIKQVELAGKMYWVVITKIAFASEQEAKLFADLDTYIDKVGDGLTDMAKQKSQ